MNLIIGDYYKYEYDDILLEGQLLYIYKNGEDHTTCLYLVAFPKADLQEFMGCFDYTAFNEGTTTDYELIALKYPNHNFVWAHYPKLHEVSNESLQIDELINNLSKEIL